MNEQIRDFFSNFGPIVFGVTVGAMAHFGQLISRGQMPPASRVFGFIMQLGLIALVAAAFTETAGIKSDLLRSLTASVLTVAANEVVNWMRARAAGVVHRLDTLAGMDDLTKGDK
jgi:hypothetical protein